MKRFLLLLLLFACAIQSRAQSIHQIVDSLRRTYEIPELAVAVVKPDTVPLLHVCGYHRADLMKASDTALITDYFHLGSNSKAITGFIAAWLVEKRKLKWNTRFFDLYPQWRRKSQEVYLDMDLSELLAHRAWIPAYSSDTFYKGLPEFKGTTAERRAEFGKYLIQQPPVPIDEKPIHYSDAGYTLAALMMEKASGKTWEQLVEIVLNEKLHLCYSIGWPGSIDSNQPWGHYLKKSTLIPCSGDSITDFRFIEPAANVSMTLPEYARFIQLNLQGQIGKGNVLKAATYEYLHFGLDQYSIGWANRTGTGSLKIEHSGSAGLFFCYTLVDSSIATAYIVIANRGGESVQKATEILLEILKLKYP